MDKTRKSISYQCGYVQGIADDTSNNLTVAERERIMILVEFIRHFRTLRNYEFKNVEISFHEERNKV